VARSLLVHIEVVGADIVRLGTDVLGGDDVPIGLK